MLELPKAESLTATSHTEPIEDAQRVLTAPAGLVIHQYSLAQWSDVRGIWERLEQASPYASFFLSRVYIDAWTEVFGPLLNPEILIFRNSDGEVVGASVVVWKKVWLGPVRAIQVFVNPSGEDEGSPQIEFNNLLCLSGCEKKMAESLAWYINQQRWDEIWLQGFCPGLQLDTLRQAFSPARETTLIMADYFVELARIREEGTTYENMLGPDHRSHLRRSYRHYGETTVQVAPTAEEAKTFLDELVLFHTRWWNNRQQPGAFVPPIFRVFHDTLIEKAFAEKHIQMLRIDAAAAPVGRLYNFIYGRDVYFYQSGFVESSEKRAKPGYVTLARGIHHCLEQPELDTFHFMAGPPGADQYKTHISTGSKNLEWLTLRKRNRKNDAIRWLRAVKRMLRNTRGWLQQQLKSTNQ